MGRPGGNLLRQISHSGIARRKKGGSGKEKLIEITLFAFQRAAA